MSRHRHALVLAIILLLGTLVREHEIGRYSLWYDELASVEVSTGRGLLHRALPMNTLISPAPRSTSLLAQPAAPMLLIWKSLAQEQHPPLYFYLLRGWRVIFGSGDVAMRSLGVVAAAAAAIFIFDAGRNWFSPTVGLWAAALAMAAVGLIDQSIQVRMYVPMVAFVSGMMSAAARIDRQGFNLRRGAALTATSLAAMLTHYFAIGPCAAVAIYFLVAARGPTRTHSLAALGIAALIFSIAWGPGLLEQRANFESNRGYLAEFAGARPVEQALRRFIQTPVRFFSIQFPTMEIDAVAFGAVYVIPILLLPRARSMLLLGLWLWLPIGLVAGLDASRGTRQLTLLRYVIGAAPAAFLIVAAAGAASRAARRWRGAVHVLPAAALLACVSAMPVQMNQPIYENYREYVQNLTADVNEHDVIIFAGGPRGDWFGGWLYLATAHYAPHWPAAVALLDAPPAPALRDAIAAHRRVWLAGGFDTRPETLFPGWSVRSIGQELYLGEMFELSPPRSATNESARNRSSLNRIYR